MENKIVASMASALGPDKIDEQFVNAALDSAVEATAAMWRMSRSPAGHRKNEPALRRDIKVRVWARARARVRVRVRVRVGFGLGLGFAPTLQP